MTLEPLMTAPIYIQLHAAAAICAVFMGPVAMLRQSRDIWHKVAGRLWILAMAATAVSSFWIGEAQLIGPFGPIHLLSLLTLWGISQGLWAARTGRIALHRGAMRSTYFWALGVAGLFTLLPGRRMSDVFFGGFETVGFAVSAVLIGLGLFFYVRTDRRA